MRSNETVRKGLAVEFSEMLWVGAAVDIAVDGGGRLETVQDPEINSRSIPSFFSANGGPRSPPSVVHRTVAGDRFEVMHRAVEFPLDVGLGPAAQGGLGQV